MRAGWCALNGPGQAAVGSCDDAAVSADGPTMHRIARRKSDRVEMIFRWGADWNPPGAGISGHQDQTTRAGHKGPLAIQHVEPVERRRQTRLLVLPSETAVCGIEDHAIRAYGPTVQLIRRKTDRADGIALWQRILPFPSAVGRLPFGLNWRPEQCRKAGEKEERQTDRKE